MQPAHNNERLGGMQPNAGRAHHSAQGEACLRTRELMASRVASRYEALMPSRFSRYLKKGGTQQGAAGRSLAACVFLVGWAVGHTACRCGAGRARQHAADRRSWQSAARCGQPSQTPPSRALEPRKVGVGHRRPLARRRTAVRHLYRDVKQVWVLQGQQRQRLPRAVGGGSGLAAVEAMRGAPGLAPAPGWQRRLAHVTAAASSRRRQRR